MKIGLTVTTHRSEKLKPNGSHLLNSFFDSFRKCNFNYDYCFYVADNQSEIPFDYPTDLNIKSYYIEDQSKTGITGAWNLSLYEAYMDGCNILWNFNDDIEFTEYTNKFIEGIINYKNKDNAVFGPLTNNGGHKCKNYSKAPSKGYTILKTKPNIWDDNMLNGFSFGFTRKVYEKYRYKENQFFPIKHKLNHGDGKWGGQEGYFAIKIADGLQLVLVNECWIYHEKFKSYVKVRNEYEQGTEIGIARSNYEKTGKI